MNKQRSFGEQILLTLMLSFGVMLILQQYFGSRNSTPQGPPKPVPTLSNAFEGIAPGQGTRLNETSGLKISNDLQKEIEGGQDSPYAHWARLRAGLIKQYILKDAKGATDLYTQVIAKAAADEADAQSTFQKGDLLWRQSTAKGPPSQEAANTLEQLVQRGRASSPFLDLKIFVPNESGPKLADPLMIPAAGFKAVAVRELRGTLKNPNPLGIVDRVNQYYSTTPFYKIFDGAVKAFGAQPRWSYGIVIILFAIMTRVLLQPLMKKQYESMRGMTIIAPEMKKVQERYKGKSDQQSQMQMVKEIRALQSKHGVNPVGGCAWGLIQIPIFIFIIYPMIQHYEPKLELSNASFLWVQSLARPDIPLLIAYGISMFFSFRLSSTPPTDDMQRQQQLIMSFAMPLVFPFFLKSYPSAFTMYWMTFNMVSTTFQYRMMKAADPNKDIMKTLFGSSRDQTLTTPVDAIPARPKSLAVKSIAASAPRRSRKESALLEDSNGTSRHNGRRRNGESSEGAASEAAAIDESATGEGALEQDGVNTSKASRNRRINGTGEAGVSPNGVPAQPATTRRTGNSARARRRRRH